MTDITKKIDRGIPVMQRAVNFSNSDAVQGDILKVETSLGFPASHVELKATGGDMRVRFNVYHQVFLPRYFDNQLLRDDLPNVTSGVTYLDTTSSPFVDISAGSTYTLDKMLAVSDIQLVTVSGNFSILCTS